MNWWDRALETRAAGWIAAVIFFLLVAGWIWLAFQPGEVRSGNCWEGTADCEIPVRDD